VGDALSSFEMKQGECSIRGTTYPDPTTPETDDVSPPTPTHVLWQSRGIDGYSRAATFTDSVR
jgi:hypothetical protein